MRWDPENIDELLAYLYDQEDDSFIEHVVMEQYKARRNADEAYREYMQTGYAFLLDAREKHMAKARALAEALYGYIVDRI